MEKMTSMAGVLYLYLNLCLVASLNISNTDESSLLSIKSQIDSDILARNWSQQTSFCTWIGVTCRRRQPPRVVALNLSDLVLRGSISPEIGNLSFLSYLDLSNNSLSGLIPEEIGKLRLLRVLDLEINELSYEIPNTLGLLRKLEFLQLSSNFLNGSIPQSLSACQELTKLDLSWNNFTGNIPSDLGNLSRLQFFSLWNNKQLTGELPPTIFNISSLVTLGLGYTQLSGNIPQEICRADSKLETLVLDNNELEGEIPSSLSLCHSLSFIDLHANNLYGQIPTQFWNLSSLLTLELDRNRFTGTLPPSIKNLSNLELMDLSGNNFYGTIPSEIGTLSKLRFLDFQNNNLNGEVPLSIFNLSTLQLLALGENNLWGSLPLSMGEGIPKIQELYLNANKFNGNIPNSISNISYIEVLELSYNSFSGLVPITLRNLQQLGFLNLADNNFNNNISDPDQDFLSSLTTCRYLHNLVIFSNPGISGALPESLVGSNLSASLEFFLVSSCNITGKLHHGIGNFSRLIWLDLSENGLSGEIPSTFRYLSSLQKLNLSYNQLQGSISRFICDLENLYSLHLDQNNFSGPLPSCFGKLSLLGDINLAGNAFTSIIPSDLWFAESLQTLNFSNNFFDGFLPQEIGNLNSLTLLDLSSNQLSGQIPSTISQLQNLITLSLSNNKLNGTIPDYFTALRNLQYLDLSENNLSGPIPVSLEALLYLSYFNVSFNNLSGEIPDREPYVKFPAECFAGNEGLCGDPRFRVKVCKRITPRKKKNKIKKYIIVGAIIGPLIVVAFILILVIRICRRKLPPPSTPNLPQLLTRKRISHREILAATNNFHEDNLIGRGSISSVYKGMFSDAMVAAVKVFNLEIQGALKSFEVECQVLSRVRHRNLVEVITSCSNLDFKAVLMVYMPNGNLERWLYSTDCSLNLVQRVGIMIDVASALEYLHQWHTFPIVHCDIKPSNILLDEDMVAHVGDFGIAKLLTEVQRMQLTTTLGTIGYMAPEYGSEGLVSTMVDVYSYGVLMMEILLKRKPTDAMFSGEFNMMKYVSQSFPNSVMDIVDEDLVSMDDQSVRVRHERCLISCMELALECTKELAEERPKMKDAVVRISNIKLGLLASNLEVATARSKSDPSG